MSDKVLAPLWYARLPEDLIAAGAWTPGQSSGSELAFPLSVASAVLDAWSNMPVVVLGGDFWCKTDAHLQQTHDSWFTRTNELAQGDAATSIVEARAAIGASWVPADWYVVFVCRWNS